MRVPRADWFATGIVGMAILAGVLWAADVAPPGFESTRATTSFALACGFVASAGAVVPGFDALVHGNRWYRAVASSLGFVALVAGIVALVTEKGLWLAVLLAATIALWAMSTVRHVRAATSTRPGAATRFGGRPHRPAAA